MTNMRVKPHDTTAVACLGRAVADALRRLHPLHTAKMVAGRLSCTVKSAENLLLGHLSAASATRLISTYGPGFMAEAVMAAAGTSLETFIDNQAAEAELAAARARERAHDLRRLQTRLHAGGCSDPGGGGAGDQLDRRG